MAPCMDWTPNRFGRVGLSGAMMTTPGAAHKNDLH